MAKEHKWGILGTGKIAADFVYCLNHLVEGAKVVAVGSRSQESANKFGEEHHIPARYGSYDALVKDPNIDVIYVASPHTFHKEHSLLALHAGKHVLCEKSVTVSAKELEEILAVAKQKKLFFMEAMWTRFFPVTEKCRELLKQGIIGDIRSVQIDFSFFIESYDPNSRTVDPVLGAGALLDVGIYTVSFASMIFGGGKPSRISAIADFKKGTGVDDQVGILLGYENSQMAVLFGSWISNGTKTAVISGTKGNISIHKCFWCPEKYTVSVNGQEDHTFEIPLQKVNHNFNFPNSQGFMFEAKHVQKCLEDGKLESPVMPWNESLEIMKTMDVIRNQIGLKYPGEV